MAQVTKKVIAKEIENRVFEVFWQSLADLTSPESVRLFLQDLLSPTEIINLSNRLAIAILLEKHWDHRSISKHLRVSTSTIKNVNIWLKNGGAGYRLVISKILKNEKADALWDVAEDNLGSFLPPLLGTNWSAIRKEQFNRRMENRRKRSIL